MAEERFKLLSAVYLFLVKDEKILMLRRYNTGYEDGNYSVPAGHIDGGEPVTSALIREAKEEAGITLTPDQISFAHVMHRITDREKIDWFFTATQWQGEINNCEPHKCDDLSWFPIKSLPDNTIPCVRTAIQNWQSSIPFSEFGWEK